MIERPTISAKEWRRKVNAGEITIINPPSRDLYKEATLLQSGEWLQKQGDQYFLFDCYSHHYAELTIEQVVEVLVREVKNLDRKYNAHPSDRCREA